MVFRVQFEDVLFLGSQVIENGGQPDIAGDESWMFCPARNRHTLNPFPYSERFPEIVAAGGFDLVVCNPPEGPLEQREWIQQYFQRHYAVYHPLVDRSAYFVEKSLSLFAPGGVVAMCMSGRWLHGSAGSPMREALGTRQIEEIVDLSCVPAGNPGAGLCLLRVGASPPARPSKSSPCKRRSAQSKEPERNSSCR